MDIIEMARQLGAAIQQSDEYTAYNVAKNAADNDQLLQQMIGEFNLKKLSLSAEVQKEDKDQQKLAALNEEVRAIYGHIMSHPTMAAYNTTKEELEYITARVAEAKLTEEVGSAGGVEDKAVVAA